MELFVLTDTIEEFKCDSSQKKTFLDPNDGKIAICAKWGSQTQTEEISTPKYLWSFGFKMPVTLTLIPPEDKFVEKPTVDFKAGENDFSFKAKWLAVAPPEPVLVTGTDAFGESTMTKPLSPLEQLAFDIKSMLNKLDMIMVLLGDLINE